VNEIRHNARASLAKLDPSAPAVDTDYVFITFIVQYLPHGLIGLLVTAFFAAALNSKAAELNALASSSTVDVYRRIRPAATDAECVRVTKVLTGAWGLFAIAFALTVTLAENLIEWSNIVGSLFYGVMLGLFLVAFFLKHVGGTATFWAAIVAECGVLVLFHYSTISYLWFNAIGCIACVALAALFQTLLPSAEPELS
jgi:Na+/proline symporter